MMYKFYCPAGSPPPHSPAAALSPSTSAMAAATVTTILPIAAPVRRHAVAPPKNPHLEPLKHRLLRLVSSGRLSDALSTLDLMDARGVAPDLVSYSSILKSCIRNRDFALGRRLHRRLLASGLAPDTVLLNSLITFYFKAAELGTAESIFARMTLEARSLVSWTAMVSGYVDNGKNLDAIMMFVEILKAGVFPNQFCYSSVIRACSNNEYVPIGRMVFGSTIKTGYFGSDVCVGCALIDMFAKVGDLVSMDKVFDEMPERNEVTWTLMITRYSQSGCAEEAVILFVDMVGQGFVPDKFTISSIVSACAQLESSLVGRQLHCVAVKRGLDDDVCVGCSLIDMYAKCENSMDCSRAVFEQMDDHNVMSWTAVINGYVQHGNEWEAVNLFLEMNEEGVRPNQFTYSCVLKALVSLSEMELGQQIYGQVTKFGLASVNCVGNSFINMFARSGRMEEAQQAFDLLMEKNMISYAVMVDGITKNANPEEAFEFFQQIEDNGIGASAFTFASLLSGAASIGAMGKGQQIHGRVLKSGCSIDRGVNNSLISLYSKCGSIGDAAILFHRMEDRNVISWTSMITALAKHGRARVAIDLFHEMISYGVKPNEVTYVAVLSACSHVGLVDEGWNHFNSMLVNHGIVPRMEHYACMVDLLGRSGYIEKAHAFILAMPMIADALVWRTLLGACRVYKNMEFGEIAAKQILELEPHDPAAYVLLSNLYASTGRWEEVSQIRKNMKEKKMVKEAGCSWIESDNVVHKFYVGDTSHCRAPEIYNKLDQLACEIKKLGYVPDTNFILYEVEEEQKEQYLFQHSEKLAVAFGLISLNSSVPIRIFKNLRVCGDCHNAIKHISVATGREIIVRDSNRFHHMKDGICSCSDYW